MQPCAAPFLFLNLALQVWQVSSGSLRAAGREWHGMLKGLSMPCQEIQGCVCLSCRQRQLVPALQRGLGGEGEELNLFSKLFYKIWEVLCCRGLNWCNTFFKHKELKHCFLRRPFNLWCFTLNLQSRTWNPTLSLRQVVQVVVVSHHVLLR